MMKITEKNINEASDLLIKNEWEYYDEQVKFGIGIGFAKGAEWAIKRLESDRVDGWDQSNHWRSEPTGNPEQLGWISVENELPEHNDPVLVLLRNGGIDIDWLDLEYNVWSIYEDVPTHWMPLPEKPKQ